jgi:rRNA-processing protein EBP2
MAKPKLRESLDHYRGKDRTREHKLKEQKKQQKAAEEKRKSKSTEEFQGANDDALLEAGVAAILAGKTVAGDEDLDLDDENWEDEIASGSSDEDEDDEDEDEEEDDEDEQKYDLAALEDSDSDSDDEEDEAGGDETEAQPHIKAPKSILKSTASNSNGTSLTTSTDPNAEAASDEEDIPLSDLDSAASDTSDIVPYQRLTINNTTALLSALNSISLPTSTLPFSEHMSLTTPAPTVIPDIDDDLSRELAFYSQSLLSAQTARQLLAAESIPFTRPTDYFAEMVKSDEHMSKIRGKLLEDAAGKKASAEARKQRDLKKFGKQVQQEKLQERAKAKTEMMDKVKSLKRKRQGEGLGEAQGEESLFDVALEDAATGERRDRSERGRGRGGRGGRGDSRGGRGSFSGGRGDRSSSGGRGDRGGRGGRGDRGGRGSFGGSRGDRGDGPPNAKRAKKDEKFGHGGKKRFGKSNDARTAGDMSGYSAKGMKAAKGGAAKRPGKARRAGAGR